MRIRTAALAGGASVLCAILVGGSLLADNPNASPQELPQGFEAAYLLVETTHGAVTVIEHPHLRALGNRTYVIGKTVSLSGVTDDELFDPTDQWVCLEDVRRMGEVHNREALAEIQKIAKDRRMNEEMRRVEEERARSGH